MAGIAAPIRELMLNWLGNIGTPTRPTTYFVQWHTDDPGAAGTDNISTGMAVREELAGSPEWAEGTADDGIVQNSTAGETAAATGADTITHFSVWSASSGGTYYFSGALTASKTVATDDTLTFGIGDLTITLT